MLLDKPKFYTFGLLAFTFLGLSVYLYSFQPAPKTAAHAVDKGKLLWQQYNCISCHQVYGLGGYLGPDLTNVYSLRSPEYLKAFIKNGTTIMPNFNFSDDEVDQLLEYLKDMDASGTADPRTFSISNDGTIRKP